MAVEAVTDQSATTQSQSRNTAEPYWIDYIACLLAKETCTPLPQVMEMPYSRVLSYMHCIMRHNGNDTRWSVVDTQQAEDDLTTINELI